MELIFAFMWAWNTGYRTRYGNGIWNPNSAFVSKWPSLSTICFHLARRVSPRAAINPSIKAPFETCLANNSYREDSQKSTKSFDSNVIWHWGEQTSRSGSVSRTATATDARNILFRDTIALLRRRRLEWCHFCPPLAPSAHCNVF